MLYLLQIIPLSSSFLYSDPKIWISRGHSIFLLIVLGLQESLPYDFSPFGKIKFAFRFLFLFNVPTLQI